MPFEPSPIVFAAASKMSAGQAKQSSGTSLIIFLNDSADTAPCDAVVRLAQRADLFLCEAAWNDGGDNPPGIHLTGRDAGELAAKADVGRLLLTHLIPAWGDPQATYQAAANAFPGPVTLVRPGDTYEI